MVKVHEDKKLKPLYRGPYLVAKVLNKNRCERPVSGRCDSTHPDSTQQIDRNAR